MAEDVGNLGPIEWSQITKTTGGFMFTSAEELLAFVKATYRV